MAAQKGSLMLIKVGDGHVVENFATIGGLRVSSMTLNHSVIDTSCVGSGQWRQLVDAAGPCAVRIEGGGLFTDTASEEKIRNDAFAGNIQNFRLYSGNGDYIQGPFMVTMYERSGHVDTEEIFMLRLESAGDVALVAG